MPIFLSRPIIFSRISLALALVMVSSAGAAPAAAQSDWCTNLGLDLARAAVRTLESALDAMAVDAPERAEYDLAWNAGRTCVSYLETLAAADLDRPPPEDAPPPPPSSLDLIRSSGLDAGPPGTDGFPVPVQLPEVPPVGEPAVADPDAPLPEGPATFTFRDCTDPGPDLARELIAQGQRTIAALRGSLGTVEGMDPEIAARISIIDDEILAGQTYLEICSGEQAPADPPSASVEPPTAAPAAPSFAGNWSGRFSGPIRAGGCETTESGTFTLRLEQPTAEGPVTGTASYNGNIVPRNCGNVSLGGSDDCPGTRIGPATPTDNRLRFQLTCAGSTETVNLTLDSGTAASGNKSGSSGQVSWEMTFNLIRS